jgi:uncharacterized membrane protein
MILIGGGKRIVAILRPSAANASARRDRRHAYFSSALRRMPPAVDAGYEMAIIIYS